jgi:multidrug efflux pump subunit AcrB
MGKTPYQAALDAADEIGLAVIAISLTIIAVFIPASFMSTLIGQFFKQFGLTISVQVFFSLLCARFITPLLAAYFLKPHQHAETTGGLFTRSYNKFLNLSVRYRFLTIGFGLGCFALSILSTRLLPSGFMPAVDTSRTLLAIELPPGSQLADTEAVTEAISCNACGGLRSKAYLSMVDGFRRPRSKSRKATVTINYVPKSKRSLTQEQIEHEISRSLADIPDIRYWFLGDENGKRNVNLIVTGQDNDMVTNVTSELAAQMRRIPTITNVIASTSLNRPELQNLSPAGSPCVWEYRRRSLRALRGMTMRRWTALAV